QLPRCRGQRKRCAELAQARKLHLLMAVSFKGDFAKLKTWADKMDTAADLMPVVSKTLADDTISLIRDGMNRGVDPYGNPYKPLVLRSGQPLKRTGGMFASWNRRGATASKFRVANGKNYAGYHQSGTGIHGPKKSPIVPKTAKALRIPVQG